MKTLIAALIAGLFGLTSAYVVASPVSAHAVLTQSDEQNADEEKKGEEKQDYKQEQKATEDGDERTSSNEQKSD